MVPSVKFDSNVQHNVRFMYDRFVFYLSFGIDLWTIQSSIKSLPSSPVQLIFLFIPILWSYRTWRTLICFSIIHFHRSFVYISTSFKINEEFSSPMTKVIPIESDNNDNICPRYQKWLKRIKKIDLHDSRKNKGKSFINSII